MQSILFGSHLWCCCMLAHSLLGWVGWLFVGLSIQAKFENAQQNHNNVQQGSSHTTVFVSQPVQPVAHHQPVQPVMAQPFVMPVGVPVNSVHAGPVIVGGDGRPPAYSEAPPAYSDASHMEATAPPLPGGVAAHCVECKRELRVGDRFCAFCGTAQ